MLRLEAFHLDTAAAGQMVACGQIQAGNLSVACDDEEDRMQNKTQTKAGTLYGEVPESGTGRHPPGMEHTWCVVWRGMAHGMPMRAQGRQQNKPSHSLSCRQRLGPE